MSPKLFGAVAGICMVAMTAAYLIFLVASWEAGKQARAVMDAKVDALLDKIPVPRDDSTTATPE